MTQDFKKIKKKIWVFSYYCLLLKSYHIIPIFTAQIGLRQMFSGSEIKILWRIYGLIGFETFFLHLSIEFLVFAFFVVVLIVTRRIVMS